MYGLVVVPPLAVQTALRRLMGGQTSQSCRTGGPGVPLALHRPGSSTWDAWAESRRARSGVHCPCSRQGAPGPAAGSLVAVYESRQCRVKVRRGFRAGLLVAFWHTCELSASSAATARSYGTRREEGAMRVGSQQTGRNEGLRNGGIERRRGVCVAGGRPSSVLDQRQAQGVGATWEGPGTLGLKAQQRKKQSADLDGSSSLARQDEPYSQCLCDPDGLRGGDGRRCRRPTSASSSLRYASNLHRPARPHGKSTRPASASITIPRCQHLGRGASS